MPMQTQTLTPMPTPTPMPMPMQMPMQTPTPTPSLACRGDGMRYDRALTRRADADIADLMGDGICDGALDPLACEAFEWDGGDRPHDDTGAEDTGEPEDTDVPEPTGPSTATSWSIQAWRLET